MASVTLYGALKGFLVNAVAPIQVLDYDQIEPQLEQGTDTFLVVEELFADEQLVSFGDPTGVCVRESASIYVHVFVPAPESSAAARTFADTLRQQIAYQRPGGVRVLSATPPEIELMNDGLWTSATIDIEAEYDRHVPMP